MKQIFTIHDRFIRSILNEDLQITAELLRSYLPSDLASYVKWDTIEPVNTAQIGPNRNMLYPDLVFRVIGESDGQQIVIYFIIEHKSYSDKSAHTQLNAYIANLSRRHGTINVVVVPVLFTHGQSGASPQRQFDDYVELPEPQRAGWMRYVQKFEMITIDLNDPDFDMGRYSIEAQAMLTTMQVINELDDRDTLCRLLRDKVRPAWHNSERGVWLKEAILWYIIDATEYEFKEMQGIIAVCLGREVDIMSLGDRLRQEGKLVGVAEGKRVGRAEGVQVGIAKGEQVGIAKGEQVGIAKGERIGITKGRAEGKQVGIAKGKRVGRAEGEQLGIAKGEQIGIAKGERIGVAKGERIGRVEDAIRMIRRNLNDDLIREITQLPVAEIERLRKTNND